jgi:transposase
MRLQTILNRVERFESFVYDEARIEEGDGGPALVVRVLPRKNSLPYRSGCHRRGRTYDHLKQRRFEFVPLGGILVFLTYRMRRVDCPRCGVTAEIVPWSDGKNRLTTTYRWFLAGWAKRLSWSEVGTIYRTPWDSVCRAVDTPSSGA